MDIHAKWIHFLFFVLDRLAWRGLFNGTCREPLAGLRQDQIRKACQVGANLLYVAILQFRKLFFV